MRKLQWKAWPDTEKTLAEFGLTWKKEEIAFNQIDEELSSHNHARRMSIDESVVSDYLQAMEHGDDFPCGVAVKQPGTGRYLVLGGNHTRWAAMEFGAKSMEFYVVDTTDPMTLDLLPKSLNRKHGLRKNKEEAVRDALNAMAQYKVSAQDAAQMFGLHPQTLYQNTRIGLAIRRLRKAGVKAEKLPKGILAKLNTIQMDSVMAEAAKLVERQKMVGPEVEAMVDAIHDSSSSEKDQRAVVVEYADRLEAGKDVAPRRTEMEKLWARYMRLLVVLDVMLRNRKNLKQMGCRSSDEAEKAIVLQTVLSKKLHALSME